MTYKNIIFIVIDTLRTGNLGCYGYDKITPNIDKLAKEGILFTNAFSTTNTTDPSITTICSGLFPTNHGILNHGELVHKDELDKVKHTIFIHEILKKHGYTTFSIDWLGRWHKRGYDYYSGIKEKYTGKKSNKLQDLLSSIAKKKTVKMISKNKYFRNSPLFSIASKTYETFSEKRGMNVVEPADKVSKTAIKILKKYNGKNKFLFIHYWDTHYPYIKKLRITPTKKHYTIPFDRFGSDMGSMLKNFINLSGGINGAIARYDSSINFIDESIGKILSCLEKNEMMEDTLIVLTGDHGESLLEHDVYFGHHAGLYDTIVHVPLIIYGYKKGVVKSLVQHTDIVPTVFAIAGIDEKIKTDGLNMVSSLIEGKGDLRNEIFLFDVHSQKKIGVRTSKYKYIKAVDNFCKVCQVDHGDKEELFDLTKDPDEKVNIITISQESEKFRKLIAPLEEAIKTYKRGTGEGIESADVVERLKNLGYV